MTSSKSSTELTLAQMYLNSANGRAIVRRIAYGLGAELTSDERRHIGALLQVKGMAQLIEAHARMRHAELDSHTKIRVSPDRLESSIINALIR